MTMKFLVTLDRDEDGAWVVECPSIPGCVSQGKAKQEALANIKEAILACLEVRAERGMPLTVETSQVEVAVWCLLCRFSAAGTLSAHLGKAAGRWCASAAVT